MKKLVLAAACAALTVFIAGNAVAEELRGRVAATARIGVTNAADSEENAPGIPGRKLVVSSDPGIIGGGGFLFGVDDNIALDLEVTRSAYHTDFGSAGVTDLAMGAQYRLPERQRLIPYAGAGVDVLINDVSRKTTDTVVGFHIAAGLDYMAMRQVALTTELRAVEAFSADVRDYSGQKVGTFDPSHLAFTVGARFFFN